MESENTKKNQWGQDVPVDPVTKQFTEIDGSSTPTENDDEKQEPQQPYDAFAGLDWGLSLKENAIAENQFAELAKNNAEQIKEAEASLGEKHEALFNLYGELFDLDKDLLAKATPEQLDELNNAIQQKLDGESLLSLHKSTLENLEKKKEELRQWAKQNLSYVWKSNTFPSIEDYEILKDKIQEKIDWYNEQLSSENPQYVTTQYPNKIKALQEWKEKYEEYKNLGSLGIDEDLIKWDMDLISKSVDEIAKFQNPNSLYSQNRKNKAVWCKTYQESKKQFSALAKKQREEMSSDERNSLTSYTGSGAGTINAGLNAIMYNSGWGSGAGQKAYHQAVLMTSALDKCISDKDVWLQRGVDEMHLGGIDFSEVISGEIPLQSLVGKEFINNSFMSCGSAKGAGFSGNLIMNIYCPKGTKMHYVNDASQYEGSFENETIIQRGYHFIIRKVEKEHGQYYMDVDLIVGSDHDRLTNEQMQKMYKKYIDQKK